MKVKGLYIDELRALLATYALPAYRADQIFAWLYQKQACNWEEMTNLPNTLRQYMQEQQVSLDCLKVVDRATADDGTVKYLLELEDGKTVESVYLPEADRRTACLSTQVGCGMGCIFCATGQMGLIRNLSPAEIIDQALRIIRISDHRLTNLVLMGQGEPLANYEAVIKALRIINDPAGLGIGARHITISTCGVVPGMKRLTEEGFSFNLAVSLHAANDMLRDRLVPINRVYPLRELLATTVEYGVRTGRRITFEYTLVDELNDSPEALKDLIHLIDVWFPAQKRTLCHVNLIPFNPVPGSGFKRSPIARIKDFAAALNQAHIETTIRKEHGTSLAGACGQLQGTRSRPIEKRSKEGCE